MKIKQLIFISILFFCTLNIFSQYSDIRKVMYVNAIDGLRVRRDPSINSERIGLLPYLKKIYIQENNQYDVIIDGIRGKWVWGHFFTSFFTVIHKIQESYEGWVFDGYLMNQEEFENYINNTKFEQDSNEGDDILKIVGLWDNGDGEYYSFFSDGTYHRGLLETSYGAFGTWYIDDNKLFLENVEISDDGGIILTNQSYIYLFKIFGDNTIILKEFCEENSKCRIFIKDMEAFKFDARRMRKSL